MSLRTLRRLPLLILLLCLALPALADSTGLYATCAYPADVQVFSGPGGAPATSISTGNSPTGVALGPDGALYVAQFSGNDVVRYDPATGKKSVFVAAGAGGLANPRGLTFGPDGNLYVIGSGGVLRFTGATGAFLDTFVPQGSGGLASPYDLAFGPGGDLYVTSNSDGYARILRFSGVDGSFVSTFVAPSSGGLGNVTGIAFGPDGGLYVSTSGGGPGNAGLSVLRYDGTTGDFTGVFVAPGSGGLQLPFGLAFGSDGDLYVASGYGSTNNRILRYDGTTGAPLGAFGTLSGLPGYLAFGPIPPAVPAPLSLSVSPGSVPGGSPAALTVTLAQPAPASSPIPGEPGQAGPGGFVRLSADRPAVTFGAGPTSDGAIVFQGNDGKFYAFIPAGNTTATIPLTTAPVTRTTGVRLSGQYGGGAANATLTLLPNSVASLVLNPAGVYNGQAGTATLTLSGPAVPGADPSSPGQTAYGAVVLLGSDTPAAQFQTGYFFDSNNVFLGSIYQGQDGRVYAFIPQGLSSLTFTVTTGFVPARTGAHLSATLNGAARTAVLTITPTLVQSLTLSPTSVYNGQAGTATLTLNGPAVVGPDPSSPGQTAYGAVVLLGSDTPAVQFRLGPIFDSSQNFVGAVYQANDGRVYALIAQGQTSLAFPVSTSFVPARTVAHLGATLNGVARTAALTITPTLVQSLTLAPATVYNGQGSTATLTLNGPAVPGADPSNPGQTAGGAVILLGSDTPAVQFAPGPIFDSSQNFVGAVYQANDGRVYAFIPQGLSSLTFTVTTGFVPTETAAHLSATLNGAARTAKLTITPTLVQSLTLAPATVYNGQGSTATLTLNGPAVVGPDPSSPGQTAYGAVVLLGSDSPSAQFSPGPIFDSSQNFVGAVYQGQDGHVYAIIAQGQTSLTFPVSTSFVPARTVAHLSATLNGATRTAAFTITPTLVSSLTLTPPLVTSGGSSSATLTLNGPAGFGPDPNYANVTDYGVNVLLGSDSAAAQFQMGAIYDSSNTFLGGVFQAANGNVYAFLAYGRTSLTFPVTTASVTAPAKARLSASLNGASQAAVLTIQPPAVGRVAKITITVGAAGVAAP